MQLLGVDDGELAVAITRDLLQVVDAMEARLAGLLDDLPRNALLLVVHAGRGPHDLGRKSPAVALELLLLLVEREIHPGPSVVRSGSPRAPHPPLEDLTDWSVNQFTRPRRR